jgi:tetratricopeptide (TPR) repeat protein
MVSSCLEETIPTNTITEEQLGASTKATEALLWAVPAFTNRFNSIGQDNHQDWGYGAMMRMRDLMTGDFAVATSNYDQFSAWGRNQYIGEEYMNVQIPWTYYYKFVQTSNNIIGAVNPEAASTTQLGYLGVGYAFRALQYLDLAQMYEFLENDKTSPQATGGSVLNLTVPIVTEATTEDEARNNPRAPRATMAEFILSDLKKAEEFIANLTLTDKVLPHLDAVYGLYARYYMWLGDYGNAKTYARKAINETKVKPMTKADWFDTTTGFNDISKWMWGSQMQKEDDVVQTGILNWTSWASNECLYGYASVGAPSGGPMSMIDARMYYRLSDTDMRKPTWKAPAGSALDGKTPFIDPEFGAEVAPYVSVKFRPNEGNLNDYNVGSASAYPLMRVEEMYFIEAEAAAHLNAGEGKTLLETFMTTYRDPEYVCTNSDVVEETVFQKRVELWGEGLSFFDYKRLNMPVLRGYPGTNFSDLARYNTTTRPAWMNFCIVRSEKNNNKGVMGFENPDPTNTYIPWTE